MAPNITDIIEKAGSKDRDFRYMACSDLLVLLQNANLKLDTDSEGRICSIMVQLTEDISGDISSLAVRCLGALATRVQENRLKEMIQTLCGKITGTGKDVQRETAMIALKTIVTALPTGAHQGAATVTVNTAVPLLLQGVTQSSSTDITNAALECLSEVVHKYGNMLGPEQTKVLDANMAVLHSGKATTRKRAIQCIGNLSAHLSTEQLDELINVLIGQLRSPKSTEQVKTYVQALAGVSKAVAVRMGQYLEQVIPLVVAAGKGAGADDDELREYCLQALESFVTRSPYHARPHVLDGELLQLATELLSHDPNYVDDMQDDDMDANGDDFDEGSEEEYSDDEDMSWKVRRAAAKCISAVVTSYPDLITGLYPKVGPRLVERFREREEQVKADMLLAYIDLLHAIAAAAKRPSRDATGGPVALLVNDASKVLAAAARQLREKSVKTRLGVLEMLHELVLVAPASLSGGHVRDIVPGLLAALQDKSTSASQLKLAALKLLTVGMCSCPPSVFEPFVAELAPAVLAAVQERYYKVVAEALRVCKEMAHVIRADVAAPLPAQHMSLVSALYSGVLPRLSAPDLDQEIKEAAIGCAAAAVARLCDAAPTEAQRVLQLLLERLRNEATRPAAIKAVAQVAASSLKPDLQAVQCGLLEELTSFLRKANRQIKLSSLVALEELVGNYGGSFPAAALDAMVVEATALVADADVLLATHALCLVKTALQQQPGIASSVTNKVLPAAMQLVQSPLLQRDSLMEALQNFLATVAHVTSSGAAIEQQLLTIGSNEAINCAFRAVVNARVLHQGFHGIQAINRAAQGSIALCVASLVTGVGATQVSQTVAACMATISNPATGTAAKRLALLVLGELGYRSDLSSVAGLDTVVSGALQSDIEEVATAASQALGGMAVSSLSVLMLALLAHIRKHAHQQGSKQQYLLLKSLNDAVMGLLSRQQSGAGLQLPESLQKEILSLLFSDTDAEEQCRVVVAECLGHMGLLCPDNVTGALLQNASAASPSMRQVVVMATRFMITERAQHAEVDAKLKELLTATLPSIGDKDRHVRKAALQTLTAALHNKPELVVGQLPTLLPLVYGQTKVDPSLVRTVDLGPFKHQIDDGLELRKAAFEALDVLLDVCLDQVDVPKHVESLASGLGDHNDVKLPCHLLLSKLTAIAPPVVLAHLDQLVQPLKSTLQTRVKSDAVKQELDRHEDMLRSCLKSIDSINHIPNVSSCTAFQELMDKVVLVGEMGKRYAKVQAERAEVEGSGDMMEM